MDLFLMQLEMLVLVVQHYPSVTVNSASLFIQKSNGKVGIGTSSPNRTARDNFC